MRTSAKILGVLVAIGLSAGTVAGASINIDSPGGDTGASSFTWQGFTFTLDDQPGSSVNAPHRVVGDTNGEIDIFLEEPGKVSYRAVLNPSTTLPTQYNLGFRYGQDLTASTPSFSDLTGLFRRINSGTEIVQQLLAGSDAGNSDSVFYGTTGRTATGGSMANQNFLANLGFEVNGNFKMTTSPDGTAQTSVTATGVTGSADFTVDLTPGGSSLTFTFNELLLQVESFQGTTSFNNQFGSTGQEFTFTNFSSQTVPEPASVALMALGGVALLARRRRR